MKNRTIACVVAVGAAAFARGEARAQCADLVGHWTFEGHTLDSSGYANNGAPSGTISYTGGVAGQALFLNGAGRVVVPNSGSLNPTDAISISAWYRPVPFAGSGNDGIVDKGASSHSPPYYQYHLGVSGVQYSVPGTMGFNVMGAGGAGTGTNFYTVGNWYHVVGTYDRSVVRLFVNGVLVNENPFTAPMTNFGRPLVIGGFSNLSFNLFGTVDEVRIFNRALAPDEVGALYENPAGGPVVFPRQPSLCGSAATTLRAEHFAGNNALFQWFKDGQPLADEPNHLSGTTSCELVISSATLADEGGYSCRVSGGCGGAPQESPPRLVRFCLGDFNCDGGVDGDDVIAFFDLWDQGLAGADVNRDEGVDGDDVIIFFAAWDNGC